MTLNPFKIQKIQTSQHSLKFQHWRFTAVPQPTPESFGIILAELKGFAAAAATAPDRRRYTPVNQRQQPTDKVVARLIEARRSTCGPGAGKDALPFGAVGDGHEYRADAKKHQTRRNYFFDMARQATAAGDKERAGKYADLGHQHNVKAQQLEGLVSSPPKLQCIFFLNPLCCCTLLKLRNHLFPSKQARRAFVDTNHRHVDSHTLDLHYLRVHDAMKELEDFIKHHQRQAEGHKEYDVDIITGAGRHSQVLLTAPMFRNSS